MSINRRCTIKIEPCNTGYQANIGFEDFYTTEDKYCHTINRATMKELKLAINDLKKSFPNHYISINNISSFQEKSTPFIHVILGILGVFILIGIAFFSLSVFSEQAKIASNTSWDKIAALFNNVGAPIFALMSYLALLYTLHQQNRSHNLSLEELALTRKELSDSTLAQKLQADTLKLQLEETKETAKKERFDNTFNSLLEQHNSTLNMLENGLLIQNGLTLKEEFDKLHENALYCRYFRLLYQILKFIAIEHSPENELNSSLFNSRIEYKEKFYSNIIRSMIPDHVLYWLAINCYCPKGESDPYIFYRKLILRYKFLEHLTLSNGKLDNIYDGFSYRKNCLILLSYDKNDLGDNLHLTNINNELLMLENSLKPKFTPKKEPDPKNQYNYKVVPNKYSVYFEILPNVVDESKLTLLSYWCGYLNRFVNNSNNKKYHGYMINIVNTISITEYSEIYNKKEFSNN